MILSFVILFLHCGRRNNSRDIQIKNGNSYEFVLSDRVTNSLKCGILKVAVAAKFKMQEGNDDLIILIPCPELYRNNFFSKGQAYRITLTTEASYCKGCTVINHYKKLDMPVCIATEIERIN
jgi:hypothetical protein